MLSDVVCFSHLRWGFVYQRPNHLMSRCARERRVFFVEEPVRSEGRARVATEEASPDLLTVVPHLPKSAGPDALRALVHGVLEDHGVRDPLLWFYTPMALAFADRIEAGLVVYDCMDELSAFHGAPPEMVLRERRLFARADLVFTGGQSLYEAKRAHHPSVHAFPSSVEAEHFARARQPGEDPPDQRAIAWPRLGFFGVIDERMDRGLLARVADAHPGWQLVLLGPVVKIDPCGLPRRPNLHYLGPKPYAELPAYVRGWDVTLMPFARNESTRFISPTKTLEYLAAGKPVVSTPIRDVVRPYGEQGLVRIGEGDEFVRQVEASLAERGTPRETTRRAGADAFVAATSWEGTWAAMDALIREALAFRTAASPSRRSTRCSTT